MNIGAIFVLIALAIWVIGILIYFIYLKIHHRPILEEECGVHNMAKKLLKAYRKQKKLEMKSNNKN